LTDASSNVINEVNYDISWYHDDAKAAGGYSLELIDPLSQCSGAINWHASIDASGGTPGRINSVVGSFEDTVPPQLLLGAAAINISTIQLTFDGALNPASAAVTSNYSLEPGITILSAQAIAPDFTIVELQVSPDIDTGTVYTFSVTGLIDCSGNQMTT